MTVRKRIERVREKIDLIDRRLGYSQTRLYFKAFAANWATTGWAEVPLLKASETIDLENERRFTVEIPRSWLEQNPAWASYLFAVPNLAASVPVTDCPGYENGPKFACETQDELTTFTPSQIALVHINDINLDDREVSYNVSLYSIFALAEIEFNLSTGVYSVDPETLNSVPISSKATVFAWFKTGVQLDEQPKEGADLAELFLSGRLLQPLELPANLQAGQRGTIVLNKVNSTVGLTGEFRLGSIVPEGGLNFYIGQKITGTFKRIGRG